MIKQQIFIQKVNDKDIKFFATNIKSDITNKNIENYAFMIRRYSRSTKFGNITFFASQEDMRKIKENHKDIHPKFSATLYEYSDIKIVFIEQEIPKGAFLHVDAAPQLKSHKGNIDLFSAANEQIRNETVEDNTIYSNRALFKRQKDSLTIEERDQKLLERDLELNTEIVNPMDHLKKLQQESNNLIEREEKKMLN